MLRAAASASLVKMREVPLSSKAPVDDKLPTVFPPTLAPLNASAQYLHVYPSSRMSDYIIGRLTAKQAILLRGMISSYKSVVNLNMYNQ